MGIRCLNNEKARGLLGFIIAVQLIWGQASLALAQKFILPGRGIDQDFYLDEQIVPAIRRFESNYSLTAGVINEGKSFFLRNVGIKLFHANNIINQIVIYNTQLSTDRYVRVFSPVDAVYAAYGLPTTTAPIPGGYYLRYDSLGIGFDIDGQSQLIRAIVIYKPYRR